MQAQAHAHAREVSIRIREGKDGPQQYARVVAHAEVPDKTTKKQIDALTDDQKGCLIADVELEQPALPAAAGMKG